MSNVTQKLDWVIVRFGQDMNWWVEEISDSIQCDIDGWSIVDPRQLAHIIELMNPLREYGLQLDIVEDAFFKFAVSDDLDKGRIRLKRCGDSLFETEDKIFALPDSLDEEKGPYADFLDHITRIRVKLLNDLIDLKQRLTIEELEGEIRDQQQDDFMEGRVVHVFDEVTSILEYVPIGFEIDTDDEDHNIRINRNDVMNDDDFPDLDTDEKIEEDETMRWDDEDEEEAIPPETGIVDRESNL